MSETSLSALLPPVRLLLLGFGNVAQAFLPLLASRSEWLGRELGIRPVINGIGTRHNGLYIHTLGIDVGVITHQPNPLLWFMHHAKQVMDIDTFIVDGKNSGASILIELTTLNPQHGQPALMHIRTALQAGMDVVTANKGPVAYAQFDLQALARRYRVQFRFESTVMDGLPLINLAEFNLQAVGIRSFRALLNSTSSLVLNLIEHGYSREEAIQNAKLLGVAERDPSYDLNGWDAVMKTTILANTLLGGQLTPYMVKREGISHLLEDDIRAAAMGGSPYRLVSHAKNNHGVIHAGVSAQRVEAEDILHVGRGTTSVISLDTQAMGTISLVEHNPTVLQTAYGVLNDLIVILQQRRSSSL